MRFRQQLPALGVGLGRLPSVLLMVAVLATLFAPALIQLAGRQSDPSFLDNRPPARAPAWPSSFSLRALGQFRSELIAFVDDNFGLRAEMVKLNVRVRGAIGVSAIPGLLIGKEGWHFLKTEVDILDQVRGLNRFTDPELDEWIDLMEAQQRWVNAQGAAFIIVIAPNPHTIYPEHLPHYVNRVWPETRLDQVMRRLRERGSSLVVVDPRHDLWAARQQALLYHKYEDHWNSLGAFIAYAATMKEIKKLVPAVQPLALSDYAITQGLRVWTIPPREEADPILTLKSGTRMTGSRPIDSRNPHRPIVETATRLDTAPTALVYGDSFGDVMAPLLNETFRRTIFVPTAHWPFPTELIETHKPDVVIVEMVERSLATRPSISEAVEDEYLLRGAPSLEEAIARSRGIGGYVAGTDDTGQGIAFVGWAADHAPAKLAIAYHENRAVGAARMSAVRLDTAPSRQIQKLGFRIVIPPNPGVQDLTRLRFFSTTADGNVYELAITPTLRRLLAGMRAPSRATIGGAAPAQERR
jgi:alginate O-acetyltransferase complex protein AlgJ